MAGLLKSNILNLLEQTNVPGVSIALVENASLTWSEAVGVKNLTARDPVDVNTVFEGASLAKTLFAYAVLKFFKNEKLSIDVPLSNYYPHSYTEWGFSADNPNLKMVTLRHILSHTSGFSNWDRLDESEPRKLKLIPGERFFYSGEGYIYLQRVLEFLSGQPLAEYMKKNIFIPFNMINSSYVWLDKFSDNISEGHGKRDEGLDTHWSKGFSAYSLYSTPSDMANFLIEIIMANQEDEFRLSLSDIHLMMSPQINITPFCSWGLGWGLEHTSHGNFFWQWGDAGDFQSFILGSIEQHWGIVVMTNSENGLKVCEYLVNEATGKEHPCASREFLNQIS